MRYWRYEFFFLLAWSCVPISRASYTEQHVFACRAGACEANNSTLARIEGQRRALSGRAVLCSKLKPDMLACQGCMAVLFEEYVALGLAPQVEDHFEPERSCF